MIALSMPIQEHEFLIIDYTKCYLLDITATPPTPDEIACELGGAIEGYANLQNGHFVVGFVAHRAVSEITVKVRDPKKTYKIREMLIFSIELTQVN